MKLTKLKNQTNLTDIAKVSFSLEEIETFVEIYKRKKNYLIVLNITEPCSVPQEIIRKFKRTSSIISFLSSKKDKPIKIKVIKSYKLSKKLSKKLSRLKRRK